jgi:4-hydroxy-tetrahydrodipicolinate synthase
MKKALFQGMATAMITPMTPEGIDYDTLGRFIEFQIENGINALVVMGTTGENATIAPRDQEQVIRYTVEKVNHRIPVIAGTGCNCTTHVLEQTEIAWKCGVDGVLVVTPYYNKATQKGLIAHFTAVADASKVPVILYNVPARTGCNLLPETAAVLAKHPNIVGIKEATGNMAQMVKLRQLCGEELAIYSGEDALTVPMMSMGGAGAISVLSNVMPKEAVAMSDACLAGDFKTAAQLQCRMLPLIDALFSEVNPIPAKAAVAAMGFGQEHLRLPLTSMEDHNRENLLKEMRKLGINV